MQTDMKAHWRALIDDSKYQGEIDRLSVQIGKSPSYLRGLLHNKSVPSIQVCMSLSSALDCSLEELVGTAPKRTINMKAISGEISLEIERQLSRRLPIDRQPTGDDVMSWWLENGGQLKNHDFLEDRFDLFNIPDTSHRELIPYRLGKKSLASTQLGTTSIDVYHKTIRPLSEKYKGMILTAQTSSLESGPVTTIERLSAIHPLTGTHIYIDYTRTFAPVTLADGQKLVLNYSKLLREPTEVPRHIS
jgi:hypothetical protein